MGNLKNLIIRFWRTGVLFLVGLVLIIYIAFGFIYLQQGGQQSEFKEQITQLSAVVARPLPSSEALQEEYEDINIALAPISHSNLIAMLVTIAEESGIDVGEGSTMFRVPSARTSQVKRGGSTYQLVAFNDIHVQGDYESVMTLISDLDSGEFMLDSDNITRETMVLKKVVIKETAITPTGAEGDRRAEFRKVAAEVIDMMYDINLALIPNPMSFGDGFATNLMGDDPDTGDTIEGFPDITTTAVERGYSGNATPRVGYVLYNHDKILAGDTIQFETVSYIDVRTTDYYYTCETDGTVRQFDGPNVATATEYLSSEESIIEFIATVSVDIYTKPK